MHRSHGHCMTMGTASTMASMVEALGIGLPGNAALPGGRRPAQRAGAHGRPAHRRDGARGPDDRRRSSRARRSRTRSRRCAAIGGSTNAVIHLIAIAGRIGVQLTLDDFDRLGQRAALPGEPAALGQVPDGRLLLRRRPAGGDEGDRARCCTWTCVTANGQTIGENIADAQNYNPRRDQAARRAVQGQGRHRGAARQPGAARRGHQAERGHAGS